MITMMGFPERQNGAVLLIALIMLIVLTLIGVNGMRTGISELRMSANEEERVLAQQTAQAVIDEVSQTPGHFIVKGLPDNVVICTKDSGLCDNETLEHSGIDAALTADTTVMIRRLYPETSNPPRMRYREWGTGFNAAYFQVESEHDVQGSSHGWAKLIQGYVLMVPSGSTTGMSTSF